MRICSKFFFILAILLSINFVAFSQEIGGTQENPESKIVLTESASTETKVVEEPFSFFAILKLIFVLALVIVVLFLVMRLLKKTSAFQVTDNPYLKQVATIVLAPGKTLHIVTLVTKGYLVGVADNCVSLIAEIDDKELIDAMNLSADAQNDDAPTSFSALLASFFPHVKKTEAIDLARDGFLQNERERLNQAFHTSSEIDEDKA